jgi:hypothetical protein
LAGISASHLSRIENVKIGVSIPVVRTLLDVYGADHSIRDRVEALARESTAPGWWQQYQPTIGAEYATYIGAEARAARVCSYDACILPGLVHTREYAHAVYAGAVPALPAEKIHQLVEVRQRRQQVLTGSDPTAVQLVVDEATIRRQVGGPQVLAGQLRHLADLAALPHVDLRVLPFSAGAHPGVDGTFVLLYLPDETVAYVESHAGQFYPDRNDSVRRLTERFGVLHKRALSPAASARMIRTFAEQHGSKSGRHEGAQ